MTWEKERYHSDEEFRLKKIRQSRKYQATKKGKKAMKKSYENSKISGYDKKWRKNNPNYYSDYMWSKRLEARKSGVCLRCFKVKSVKGLTICSSCRCMKVV